MMEQFVVKYFRDRKNSGQTGMWLCEHVCCAGYWHYQQLSFLGKKDEYYS
jgi:hypothetical protein